MEAIAQEDAEYKTYKKRYLILLTVILLNISNAALWINYSPVATTVASYYGKDVAAVNWFSMSYFIMSIPFVFISTLIVDKLGLRLAIHLGSGLNCLGGIVRAVGTCGLFQNLNTQYAVSLFGQCFSAMAQSFLLFIPTKVSQSWFPETQRGIATTFLAMSNPLGIVIAQGVTPSIVKAAEDVPLDNYIWAGLAMFAQLATIAFVTSAKPPTPPSRSAEKGDSIRPPYLSQLKMALTNVPYLILMLALGASVGLFSSISTVTQQMLCPLGYSDIFSGLTIVVMIMAGFIGSVPAGILADKTKKFTEIIKLAFGLAVLSFILMFEFYLVPKKGVLILIGSALFGFFGVGAYPVGLELAVELTYPVEETISTAFVFLSAQVQGVALVALIPTLATGLSADNSLLNVCHGDPSQAKQYSIPVTVVISYMSIAICIMIACMKTKYKRLQAEESHAPLPNAQDHKL